MAHPKAFALRHLLTPVLFLLLAADGDSCVFSGHITADQPLPDVCIGQSCGVKEEGWEGTSAEVIGEPGSLGVRVKITPGNFSLKRGHSAQIQAQLVYPEPEEYPGFDPEEVDHSIVWTIREGAIGGTLSQRQPVGEISTTEYTAPSIPGVFTIIATSVMDSSARAHIKVRVKHVLVAVSPAKATVRYGSTQKFTAAVSGATNAAVLWQVVGGSDNGTVSPAGLYRAPISPEKTAVTLRAISVEDPTVITEVQISLTAQEPPNTVVCPASTSLFVGDEAPFAVYEDGQNMTAFYDWTVHQAETGAAGAVIHPSSIQVSSAMLVAGEQEGEYVVRATSQSDPSKFIEASVAVRNPTLEPIHGIIHFAEDNQPDGHVYIVPLNTTSVSSTTIFKAGAFKLPRTEDMESGDEIFLLAWMDEDGSGVFNPGIDPSGIAVITNPEHLVHINLQSPNPNLPPKAVDGSLAVSLSGTSGDELLVTFLPHPIMIGENVANDTSGYSVTLLSPDRLTSLQANVPAGHLPFATFNSLGEGEHLVEIQTFGKNGSSNTIQTTTWTPGAVSEAAGHNVSGIVSLDVQLREVIGVRRAYLLALPILDQKFGNRLHQIRGIRLDPQLEPIGFTVTDLVEGSYVLSLFIDEYESGSNMPELDSYPLLFGPTIVMSDEDLILENQVLFQSEELAIKVSSDWQEGREFPVLDLRAHPGQHMPLGLTITDISMFPQAYKNLLPFGVPRNMSRLLPEYLVNIDAPPGPAVERSSIKLNLQSVDRWTKDRNNSAPCSEIIETEPFLSPPRDFRYDEASPGMLSWKRPAQAVGLVGYELVLTSSDNETKHFFLDKHTLSAEVEVNGVDSYIFAELIAYSSNGSTSRIQRQLVEPTEEIYQLSVNADDIVRGDDGYLEAKLSFNGAEHQTPLELEGWMIEFNLNGNSITVPTDVSGRAVVQLSELSFDTQASVLGRHNFSARTVNNLDYGSWMSVGQFRLREFITLIPPEEFPYFEMVGADRGWFGIQIRAQTNDEPADEIYLGHEDEFQVFAEVFDQSKPPAERSYSAGTGSFELLHDLNEPHYLSVSLISDRYLADPLQLTLRASRELSIWPDPLLLNKGETSGPVFEVPISTSIALGDVEGIAVSIVILLNETLVITLGPELSSMEGVALIPTGDLAILEEGVYLALPVLDEELYHCFQCQGGTVTIGNEN